MLFIHGIMPDNSGGPMRLHSLMAVATLVSVCGLTSFSLADGNWKAHHEEMKKEMAACLTDPTKGKLSADDAAKLQTEMDNCHKTAKQAGGDVRAQMKACMSAIASSDPAYGAAMEACHPHHPHQD